MTDRLATGIELLDRRLHGGVPRGSITAVLSQPASQSELLLYELAAVRPALYLTTVRAAEDVRATLTRVRPEAMDVVVSGIDPGAPVAETLELVDELPEQSTLIVDPIDALERLPAGEYRAFLNELRSRLAAANAVGIFHCLDGRDVPPLRDTTEYVVDVVFRLSTERRGEAVENYLTVPKFRGGQALEDVIKLSLTTDVDVDISRNLV
jgi:KaiC/GvpD/RAD55 family RecA-like ATPase